ncbi:MAG: hypothetical protein VYE77_04865 [Planctomycetota bacterium]|nr:hypothetical protein [Planctomycetota bacterium]
MTVCILNPARAATLVAALLAGACQGTIQVIDQRPSFVERQELRSTIWLGLTEDDKDISSMASAIIISRNVLLTNAHVWATKEPDTPWWEADLPAERTIFLSNPEPIRITSPKAGEEPRHRLQPLLRRRFRLLATGTQGLELPTEAPDSQTRPEDLWTRDWALIETDQPNWLPTDAAPIYAKALDPSWTPPPGTKALIAGYSSLFLGEDADKVDEEGVPTANVLDLALFLMSGPYVLSGNIRMIEGKPAVTYRTGWPSPGGHSGGGVYVLNADTQRPELIGVFHTYVPVRVAVSLFGITLGAKKRWYLCYAPLGEFLSALREHGRLPSTAGPGRRSSKPGASAAPEVSGVSL